MRTAAFFDMDHTLVNGNTGSLFMRWKRERGEVRRADFLRYLRFLAQYSVGAIDATELREKAASSLRGTHVEAFDAELEGWYERLVRPRITEAARQEVERRRARGDVLVVLSASLPFAVRPLADDLAIGHVICSEFEVDDGRFTGRFAKLCYGSAKVEAAVSFAREHGIDLERSAFYTDSVSDLPLLRCVGEPRIVNPDPRLLLHARRQGWRIESWS